MVLRKFEKELKASMEFRGFVHEKKLNALSQYYDVCFYPELVEKKDEIKERVLTFFEQIKDSISVDNFILDFVVLEDRIMIIELNPWATTTGAALYVLPPHTTPHLTSSHCSDFRGRRIEMCCNKARLSLGS